MDNKKLLSIIIPCFNEEEVISETFKRILKIASEITYLDIEIIFIDDGSKDLTPVLLQNFVNK